MSGGVGGRALTRRGTLLGALASTGLALPAIARAEPQSVRVALLHPTSGPLAHEGLACRHGALAAIETINAAGGIRALGGAQIEPLLDDTESDPEAGVRAVRRIAASSASAILGPYSSGTAFATTEAAAEYGVPHVIDVAVADALMTRHYPTSFRLGPGFSMIVTQALDDLHGLAARADPPARTVFVVQEDSAFGANLTTLLTNALARRGLSLAGSAIYDAPLDRRQATALARQAADADIVVPPLRQDAFAAFAAALATLPRRPRLVYSILSEAASNLDFLHRHHALAQDALDCNSWYDPRKPIAQAFRRRLAQQGFEPQPASMLNFASMQLIADALEHAASSKRDALRRALATSHFAGHIMPYGPTRFVGGQNESARPVVTQVQGNRIDPVYPADVAIAAPILVPRGDG